MTENAGPPSAPLPPPARPCRKCLSTDRYPNGACRPCGQRNSARWKRNNPEANRRHQSEHHERNRERRGEEMRRRYVALADAIRAARCDRGHQDRAALWGKSYPDCQEHGFLLVLLRATDDAPARYRAHCADVPLPVDSPKVELCRFEPSPLAPGRWLVHAPVVVPPAHRELSARVCRRMARREEGATHA